MAMLRQTRTYALMVVPKNVYDFVRKALERAGYDHAIMDDGELDMQGIALTKTESPEPASRHPKGFTAYSARWPSPNRVEQWNDLPEHSKQAWRDVEDACEAMFRSKLHPVAE